VRGMRVEGLGCLGMWIEGIRAVTNGHVWIARVPGRTPTNRYGLYAAKLNGHLWLFQVW
jgi:hypothetical protein